MPTGYTASVGDGKVTEFRTFALNCARAFGACIMQRDDNSTDLPKHREMSWYNAQQLDMARTRLGHLESLTPDEAAAEYDATVADARKARDQYEERKRETEGRYRAMLAQVAEWAPPTADHRELKAFMAEQLNGSIKFDCTTYPELYRTEDTVDEWLSEQKAKAQRDIEYHKKGHAEEEERVRTANQWIDALYASLPTGAAIR